MESFESHQKDKTWYRISDDLFFNRVPFDGLTLSPAGLKCHYPSIEELFGLRLQDTSYIVNDIIAPGKMLTTQGFFPFW